MTASLIPNCACGHLKVLHDIRGNGSRGACSVSTGPEADRCGCKAYAAEPVGDALFDITPPASGHQGGAHL